MHEFCGLTRSTHLRLCTLLVKFPVCEMYLTKCPCPPTSTCEVTCHSLAVIHLPSSPNFAVII